MAKTKKKIINPINATDPAKALPPLTSIRRFVIDVKNKITSIIPRVIKKGDSVMFVLNLDSLVLSLEFTIISSANLSSSLGENVLFLFFNISNAYTLA